MELCNNHFTVALFERSSLQASQASATDLRLWCSYVQLLVLLDSREEAVKVAEKALSMVEVSGDVCPASYSPVRVQLSTVSKGECCVLQLCPNATKARVTLMSDIRSSAVFYGDIKALLGSRTIFALCWRFPQKLPEDKKPPSAELFWLAFRLQAGLPLSPRDSLNSLSNKDGAFADLFRQHGGAAGGSREMALRVLCSFAEGSFKRSKTKKSQVWYRKCENLDGSACVVV